MAFKTYLILGAILGLVGIAFAAEDIVSFTQCGDDDSSSDENSSSASNSEPPTNCTISQLKVDPCPEAAAGLPCKVKRGTNIRIIFDYVPQYGAEKVSSRAYWANSLIDVPLLGMDTNACSFSPCPIEANKTYTYTYILNIADFFPVRSYDVKWKLWSDNMECCFLTKIKLTK